MAANCTAYGSRNDANFNHPLPAIGLYVAAASLVCAICIGLDLYRSLLSGRRWIASKLFSLNAATLTVLAVAVKITSDITTPMPGLVDQLAKQSGTVLVSITMNHVMPSLGSLDGVGILSNVIALGILVVTLFVNVWFQICTGVVLGFEYYNTLFAITMLILYVIFVSYSLTVSTTKRLLEKQYETKHEKILQDMPRDVGGRISLDWLKNNIDKYWLMALTSSPDYTLLSSGMCSVSAIICYGNVGNNFIIALEYLRNSGGRICYISSDYDWSVAAILSFQCLAISIGLIASVLRGINSRPGSSFSTWRGLPKIEKHWVQLLVEWKQAPLEILENKGRRMRKVIHSSKNFVLGFLLMFQICVILTCKVFLVVCIWIHKYVISFILCLPFMLLKRCAGAACWFCCCRCCRHKEVVEAAEERLDYDLREYVLHIEGEEEKDNLTAEVVRRWRKHPQKWIESGRANKPKHLLDLLKNNKCNLFARVG